MDISTILSKFNGPFHEDKYNQFFNPNLCHVCKSPNDGKLIPCGRCDSIYYCCEEHKAMHEESHQKVCEGLVLAIRSDPNWYTRCCNFKEWIDLKRSLILFIKMHIRRKLRLYEIEMCFCAKSCDICHRMINLETCTYCYSINYCDEHIQSIISHVDCQNRLLLLNLNIANMNSNICNEYPGHLKNAKFPTTRICNDMMSFVNAYTNHPKEDMWPNQLYIFTDYVTGPLTLYNAFDKANLLNYPQHCEFVIHIIGGSAIDVTSLKSWQILLHFFFTVKKLHIVMIKPEMVFESTECNLCYECTQNNKKLYFEYVSESYCNYVNMNSYKQPNVIVGFDVELSEGDLWSESLPMIHVINCPLLLTVTSKMKLETIMYITGNILRNRNSVHGINFFSSCRPNRDYEIGGIFFRKSYYILYQ